MTSLTTSLRRGASDSSGKRPSRALLFVVVAVIVVAATWVTRAIPGSRPAAAPTAGTAPGAAAASPAPAIVIAPPEGPLPASLTGGSATSTASLDKAIGVWTANLRDDPEDFVSAQNLALDYYTRGRLTGSVDDYDRAQAAVRTSLSIYPDDPGTRTMQALLQYTLHDFAASLATAQAVYDADHAQLQALATIGDDQLELGEYTAAASTYATLAKAQPGAAVTARLAHLASLQGRDADAAALATKAATEARAEGADGSGLAFYDYLAGYIAFQGGKLDVADQAFGRALAAWPGSYLALEGRARVRAAEGRFPEAIALYRKAIAIVPQPEFLSGLGDLYALEGQQKLADEQYGTVRVIARLQALQAQVFNRQLVLFDVNHGENLPAALDMAQRELAVRKDVYGWDAYAWALVANGRARDADAAMANALALGTHDALLEYHAGVIAHAVGDDARARRDLTAALDLNPAFDPLQAKRARDLLASLGG